MVSGAPEVSIIVPAYNEELRVGATLAEIASYFGNRGTRYEVLVVSDGSSDGTSRVVSDFHSHTPAVRLIEYSPNRGKGYAVRTGMQQARGSLLLFDDADGATPIAEIAKLERAIHSGADLAIGSRALSSEDAKVKALWYRKVIGRTFNFLVNSLLVPDIADTQCGFKLFTADAARKLFSLQRADRFSFDVELLYLARKLNLQVKEVAVNWHNVPGSKVNLVADSFAMSCDLMRFRMNDLRGMYDTKTRV